MIPKYIRNRCLFISNQIKNDFPLPLDQKQKEFISKIFYEIGNGEDPSVVFNNLSKKGLRKIDQLKEERIGQVINLIALDLAVARKEGEKLTVIDAIRNNIEKANKIFEYKELLTEETISRWYYNKKYKHYKNLLAGPLDL